jgi:hypothetical protein
MVRFEENKLIIEINSPDPIDEWMQLQTEIYNLLRHQHEESTLQFNWIFLFLNELQPAYECAMRMNEE